MESPEYFVCVSPGVYLRLALMLLTKTSDMAEVVLKVVLRSQL